MKNINLGFCLDEDLSLLAVEKGFVKFIKPWVGDPNSEAGEWEVVQEPYLPSVVSPLKVEDAERKFGPLPWNMFENNTNSYSSKKQNKNRKNN